MARLEPSSLTWMRFGSTSAGQKLQKDFTTEALDRCQVLGFYLLLAPNTFPAQRLRASAVKA